MIRAGTLLLSLSVACSSTSESPLSGSGDIDEPFETTDPGSSSETGQDDSASDPTDSGTQGTSGGTGGGDGSTGSGGDDGPGPSAEFPDCPDPMPEGWVFCEDFEQVEEPADIFFDYQDDDGAFVLDDKMGASGERSMRASYRTGMEAAGWFSVSFGENPVAQGAARPQYDEATAFEEVYWRFRIRMQKGWPNAGPHKLTRLTAFADPNWGEALVAQLSSNGDDVVLAGDASTCVYGNDVPCEGSGDMTGLESLGLLVGDAALFSDGFAGQWHCVEAHVKLNTPGEADGVFEFWVDGNAQNGRDDLDWRGTWTDYGLNLLSIENFWSGGAPEDLNRWIDDVVISTSPIGCE